MSTPKTPLETSSKLPVVEHPPEQEESATQEEDLDDVQHMRTENKLWNKKWIVFLMMGLLLGVAAFGLGRVTSDSDSTPDAMHDHGNDKDEATIWTCSMHPQIQSSEPGACPLCGMDLIPLVEETGDTLTPDQIRLSESARILARIQTEAVAPASKAQGVKLHLLGRLEHDETRVHTVTAWTSGRIDRLKVASTGAQVKKGQAIATLYSPEIYAAQQDLIQARKQLARLKGGLPIARSSAEATQRAARQRLRLLGVNEGQIRRMESAESAWRHVQIHSSFAGTVQELLIAEGQYVNTGTGIYRLVDLSSLWIQLDAYERDLPLLKVGQSVSLSFEAFPGEVFTGKATFIDPVVDAQTRIAKVRVEVSNKEGRLKPGMFARGIVNTGIVNALPALTIPASAALFSGRRSLVYVEMSGTDSPTYEAREVRLGSRVGDRYPVVAGLEYGERVVTHGAFRLDADLQIRGGRSLMARPDDTTPAAFDRVIKLSERDRAQLAPVISAYLNTQEALASDDLSKARVSIEHLLKVASGASLEEVIAKEPWQTLKAEFEVHGRYFLRSGDLERARVVFETLTLQVSRLLEVFGNPVDHPVRLAYCPMAFDNRGAEWFQRGEEVHNTYFGAKMLRCGEVRDSLGSHEFKAAMPAKEPVLMPTSSPDSTPASEPSSRPGGAP